MAIDRFVNLNKTPVHVPGPQGGNVVVHPYREALDARSRRPDAIYVVEGAFWARFAGTVAGPLHRHPTVPKAYGLDAFPDLPVHHLDGRANDGALLTNGDPRAQVAATALPGRYRAAGDVITPRGTIRRRNPVTGEDEEVPDTPENRTVLLPVNAPGPAPEALRKSIEEYLSEQGITTVADFNKLTDEQLLQIPGMHPLAIRRLRENVAVLLTPPVEAMTPEPESYETAVEAVEEDIPVPPPVLRTHAQDTVSSAPKSKKPKPKPKSRKG